MAEQHLITAAELLAREAADTKAAIDRTLGLLKKDITAAADPRIWAKRHPWASVGAAAATGFVAAKAVMPGRDETLSEKFLGAKDRLRQTAEKSVHFDAEAHAEQAAPAQQRGLLASLVISAADLIKVVLTNVIISAFREPSPVPSHNGHEEAASPYAS